MKNILKLSLLFFVILCISIQASGKTLNLIDIYRESVFDIAVLRNRKPVIVYYTRGSCTLCSRLEEKMERMAKKNSEILYLAKVDLDKLPELKEKFGITSIPTTRAFYKGEMLGEVKGPKWISMSELTDQIIALKM